jgi:hypothetical protein
MSCPPDIAEVILEILRMGLVRIRAQGWKGDSAGCAHEADHLHNLPELLSNYSPERLLYYWELEKPAYCSRGEGNAAFFESAWERLHELLRKNSIA